MYFVIRKSSFSGRHRLTGTGHHYLCYHHNVSSSFLSPIFSLAHTQRAHICLACSVSLPRTPPFLCWCLCVCSQTHFLRLSCTVPLCVLSLPVLLDYSRNGGSKSHSRRSSVVVNTKSEETNASFLPSMLTSQAVLCVFVIAVSKLHTVSLCYRPNEVI